MRKLSFLFLVFGLLLVGCDSDSGSDDASDAELFVGSWALGGISDSEGDRTAAFVQGFNSVAIGFTSGEQFTLAVDAVIDEADANYSGTYTISEATSTVSVSLNVGGQPFPLSFTYEIEDDSHITLQASSTTAVLLASLFSTSFTPPVSISLVKV